MTFRGGSGSGARGRTTAQAQAPTKEEKPQHTDHPLLPLEPECTATQWYIGRIPWKHRNRATPVPNHRPVTRAELTVNGVTRAQIRDRWVSVDYGMYLHVDQLLPEVTDSGFRRTRRVHPATLALAHLIRHPQRIATGFAAAPFHGMRYFVDEEQLEFLTPKGVTVGNAPEHVLLTPTRHLEKHRSTAGPVHASFPHLLRTGPWTTLSHMLRTVSLPDAGRAQRWKVPDLSSLRPGFTPEFIRCVQVSDALHHATGSVEIAGPELLRVPGGADAVTCAPVLGFTDVGAESPQETLLRLAVSDLAPGLRSQIPVFREDGTLLTVSDLGWEERGLHLMYDGVHHQQREQRDHDSEVLAALQHGGGRVLRVTAGNLASVDAVSTIRERVVEALRH